MSAPTYIELVNAIRRVYEATNGRRYYERVIRTDDSPALHEPRDLVAISVEVADLCRRIGPVPAEPTHRHSAHGCVHADDDADLSQWTPPREPQPTARTWDVEADR